MQISKLESAPDAPYQKMYTTLFNAVTTALDMIGDSETAKAQALLIRAQQETEELYIEAGAGFYK